MKFWIVTLMTLSLISCDIFDAKHSKGVSNHKLIVENINDSNVVKMDIRDKYFNLLYSDSLFPNSFSDTIPVNRHAEYKISFVWFAPGCNSYNGCFKEVWMFLDDNDPETIYLTTDSYDIIEMH